MLAGRLGKVVLLLISVFIVAPLGFCVALPIGINEIKAMNWSRQYLLMEHPPGTERIALQYGVEKTSNGDNCDYIYLEARSYRLEDRAAVAAAYRGKLSPISAQGPLLSFEEEHADSLRYAHGRYRDFLLELAKNETGPYYTIMGDDVLESAPPLIDWRCT